MPNSIRIFGNMVAALGAAIFMMSGATAWAHRLPEVVITIVHTTEEDEAVTQLTYRVHAQDVLKILAKTIDAPSLEKAEHLEAFGNYILENVDLGGGKVIHFGGEVDGNYVFIYHVGLGHRTPLGSTILSDLNPDWLNQINITSVDGKVTSMLFHDKEKGAHRPHRH